MGVVSLPPLIGKVRAMVEFAVRVDGEDQAKGWWVLAIDSEKERLLLARHGPQAGVGKDG